MVIGSPPGALRARTGLPRRGASTRLIRHKQRDRARLFGTRGGRQEGRVSSMSINRLDHVSIRTHDLDATHNFYADVLGLSVGPRPNFPFPGVWLYQDQQAVVHVIGVDPNDSSGLADYLGDRKGDDAGGSGNFD